jgi:two-component system, NtrC family, response regulator GlrR
VEVKLPALRERAEDLPVLIDHLLSQRSDVRPEIAAQLRQIEYAASLVRHPWPGNVRELRNHLERCIALREALELEAAPAPMEPQGEGIDVKVPYSDSRKRWLERFERRYLELLLAEHGENLSEAARAARIDRAQLYRLLWRHGLRERR